MFRDNPDITVVWPYFFTAFLILMFTLIKLSPVVTSIRTIYSNHFYEELALSVADHRCVRAPIIKSGPINQLVNWPAKTFVEETVKEGLFHNCRFSLLKTCKQVCVSGRDICFMFRHITYVFGDCFNLGDRR